MSERLKMVVGPLLAMIVLAVFLVAALPFLDVTDSSGEGLETALQGEDAPPSRHIAARAEQEAADRARAAALAAARAEAEAEEAANQAEATDAAPESEATEETAESVDAAPVESEESASAAETAAVPFVDIPVVDFSGVEAEVEQPTVVLAEPSRKRPATAPTGAGSSASSASEETVASGSGEATTVLPTPIFGTGERIPIGRLVYGDLLPGVVRPLERARVAASGDGSVRSIHVREGQRVTRGQRLFELNDEVAQAAVASAEAAYQRDARIEAAEAQVQFATDVLRRTRNAAKDGAASGLEVAQAESSLHQAEAGLKAAKEELEQQRRNLELERRRLDERRGRAPFTGIVRRITRKEGDSVRSGQEILQLVNMDTLEVELHVPFRLFATLKLGNSYRLLAGNPVNREITAELHAMDPVVDAASEAIRCVFHVPNADGALPAGFFARIIEEE